MLQLAYYQKAKGTAV